MPGHHSLLAPPVGPRLIQSPSSSPPSQTQSTAPDSSTVPTNAVSSEASSLSGLHHCRYGSYTVNPLSSLQRAAQIYSQRLSQPSSAKAGLCRRSPSRQRVASVRMQKDPEDASCHGKHYSPSVVAAELQQLSEKQATRQYTPLSHISLLTQQLTNLSLASGAVSKVSAAAAPGYQTTLGRRGLLWAGQPDCHVADRRAVSSAVRFTEYECRLVAVCVEFCYLAMILGLRLYRHEVRELYSSAGFIPHKQTIYTARFIKSSPKDPQQDGPSVYCVTR
ncbi:tubulin polyglutamylase TTLL5-like [Eudromia elegans]